MNIVDELFEEPPEDGDRLAKLGIKIAELRTEAVEARRNSGIEAVWNDCEEAYVGIDDANRGEFSGARWAKPTSMTGPVQTDERVKNDGTKSTLFVRLTSRYVDAGAAKLSEIILPIDDKAFSFEATPIPDLVKRKDDDADVAFDDGTPMTRPPKDGEGGAAVPIKVKDFVEESIKLAEGAAKKAETRIHDWQIECQRQAEMRKVLFDGARIGTGCLKGPVPTISKATALSKNDAGAVVLKVVEKVVPSSKWVDPWNIFPDPSCGEDIHDGEYFFERDFLSAKQLRALKKLPGYLPGQIDRVLKEGPNKCNTDESPQQDNQGKKDKRFEVFFFYGEISREEMLLTNCGCSEKDMPEGVETVYSIVTMVNDSPIKAVFNPLDSGRFPYNVFPWQRRPGSWAGVGVAEQVAVPQSIVKNGTRALLNNAGLSSGVQIVIDKEGITPANNQYTVTPNKIWYKGADSTMDDVSKAFQVFTIPGMQNELQALIDYGFRLAEECSSIPLVTQGQSGSTAPDTLGGMQLQNNNANQLLRNVGYNVDDYITEPEVRAYYEWLLLDPEVPEEEKGDFKINAHGSSALIERAIQDQTLLQLGNMVLNPIFGKSPARWFDEMLKSKKLNPNDFDLTEEEKQAQAKQQPAPAPAVQAAEIREQGAEKRAQLHEQAETQRTQIEADMRKEIAAADTDRDAVYVQAETERTRQESADRKEELAIKYQLAVMAFAEKRQITLDEAKTELAKLTMSLTTQRELAAMRGPQVATPPTEPPGRAPAGEAYQK